MSTPVRLYFLGSGRLGLPVLRALAAVPHLVVAGVGTQPDRPQGRSRQLAPTVIGALAAELGLPVDKPENVNDPVFLESLRALDLDVLVVVAYGQLLREAIINLPRHGCLNVHASLLPRFRGAAPIQAAIFAGDAETGVSFMQIDRGLDTGPVFSQVRMSLTQTETEAGLEAALGDLAAAHLPRCIQQVCREGLAAVPQPAAGVVVARKIQKGEGKLLWSQPAVELERRIRALSPWPGAFFELPTPKGDKRILVSQAEVVSDVGGSGATPGSVVRADQHEWLVACGQGGLRLVRVKPEGRPEMTATEFLRGHGVPVGTLLK